MKAIEDDAALRAVDRSGLLAAYLSINRQLADGFAAAHGVPALPSAADVRSVVFSGMGGSAAPGDVTAAAYADVSLVPLTTVRGYVLPAHCGPETLLVCVSYSGSTEETLATVEEATRRRCRVVTVSADGALGDRSRSERIPHVSVTGGLPHPRTALGALTGAVLGILSTSGVIDAAADVGSTTEELGALAVELAPEAGSRPNEAKDVAEWVGDRMLLVWGSEGVTEPAAWRWKCAFNENAKIPAFSSSFPELDHHEIEGWSPGLGEGFRLIVLRDDREHETVGPRLEATLEVIAEAHLEHREVWARGSTPLARALSLALIGDTASAYHAIFRGIDPGPIDAIARVKARLR